MQRCFMFHKDQLPDLVLYELWDRVVDSGTERATFPGGEATDHHSFRDLIRRDCNDVFVVFYEGEPGGIIWLNDRREKSARVHFTVFRNYWGRRRDELPASLKMGRYAVARLMRETGLDVLMGFTPMDNRLACKFIQRLGAQPVGVMPKAAWNAKEGKSEEALVTAITLETTEDEWLLY